MSSWSPPKGIRIDGISNRSLTFDNVYQELTIGSKFIDFGGGGTGIGLTVCNSFGGGSAIDPVTGWQSCHFYGNSLLTESAAPVSSMRCIKPMAARSLTSDYGRCERHRHHRSH
jgi:hypothetical protein